MSLAAACAVVTVGIVVVGDGSPAAACDCMSVTDVEAFDGADTVFTGTLVEIETPPPGEVVRSDDPERFVFVVDSVYKGTALARQPIVTPLDGASCGLEIAGPGPFLVFATTDGRGVTDAGDGELFSYLCSGTRALADGAVPATFGAARQPTPAPDDGVGRWFGEAFPAFAVAIVIGVAIAALFGRSRIPTPGG